MNVKNPHTFGRRSFVGGAAAAIAAMAPFSSRVGSQPVQPIQQADPIGPDGTYSLLRQDGSAMFSNARLNLAAFGDTGLFGNAFHIGMQIIPARQEIEDFLNTGATHVGWLVNITNVKVTDIEWGNGDRLRSAGMQVWSDETGSSALLHCLNIIKPNPEDGLRWEVDKIAAMSMTLNGNVLREGSVKVSSFLIPGVYRLVGEGEDFVYSRDENSTTLRYDFDQIGDPAQATDPHGNTEFLIASI